MKPTVCVFWITFWLLCSIAVQAEHKKPDSASSFDSKFNPKAIDDTFDNTLPFPSSQTEREKLFELDQKLNSRLQDFDEMLLIEKDLLSEEKRMSRSASGLGEESGTGENGGENVSGDSGSGQSGRPETADVQRGGFSRKNRTDGDIPENGRSQQGSGRVTGQGKPFDNSGGHDDDIVARQLREAAEKEIDPALRKKLWDEYNLYKQDNN